MEFMKAVMMATILLNYSPNKMLIQNYRPVPEMDYQMLLSLPTPNKRMLLDCQSFFNAIYHQTDVNSEWKEDWSLIIDGGECDEISRYAKESLDDGKPFCLSVDLKTRIVDMSSNIEECS